MRRILNIFTAVALMVCAFGLTACGDDDDDNNTCYYTLGIGELSVSGTGSEAAVMAYLAEVEEAYYQALGMTEGNYLTRKGDFDTINKELRSKFDSASLPEPLVWDGGNYRFTIKLTGTDSSDKTVVVATKTFNN